MRGWLAGLLAAGLLTLAPMPAHSQAKVVAACGSLSPTFPAGSGGQPLVIDVNGNLCVNASVSASISPFTPSAAGARGTPFTVTVADSSGTLPTGASVVVANAGVNPMYCNVNGVAATVSDQLITASGGWFIFGIPNAITTLHCIATGGSTIANMVGGAGLAAGTGGGGGGGSGGSVTQGTSPWVVGQASAAALNATVVGTGTFPVQAAQSGTYTVQPGNTPNTTPWLMTNPGAASTMSKVTIAVTNTYIQALASNTARKGCMIQYIAVAGSKGYVIPGSAPGDTTTSYQLTNGQTFNCQSVAVTDTSAIQVTGTATDIFIVSTI